MAGGPDVWEVIRVVIAEGGSAQATADSLRVSVGLVESAIAYYADNRAAIDDWIAANEAMMRDAADPTDAARAGADARAVPPTGVH